MMSENATIPTAEKILDLMSARFIQLTKYHTNKSILILCNNILSIEELTHGTRIHLHGMESVVVMESIEEISVITGIPYVT